MQTLLSRRAMIAAAALPFLVRPGLLRAAEPDLAELSDMTGGAVPIGPEERERRLARRKR